jgi:hypothetical protein
MYNQASWQIGTWHGWGKILVMQNDGNLVLYTDRVPVWARTVGRISYPTASRANSSFKLPCIGIQYDSINGWSFGCN